MTNRLWELLALQWSGEISTEEKAELEELLLQHPGDWLRTGQLDQLSFHKAHPPHEKGDTDALMDKVLGTISPGSSEPSPMEKAPRRKFPGAYKYQVSIAFIMIAITAGLTFIYLSQQRHRYKIVSTDAGMKTKIRLSDGSIIWLNAGSTLRYPEKLDKAKREVYLSGEAYFDIKQAPNRPFIIHAQKMDIRVLGTTFNVRSYKEEDFEETSVISGAVEVTVPEEHKVMKVTPNQKVVLHKTSAGHMSENNTSGSKAATKIERQPLSVISPADTIHVLETAWLNNQLIFRNETLLSLSQRLERWYGIKIIIEDQQLAMLRFSGRADNISIEKLLEVLQNIQPFNYSIQDDIVTIK
ncbi:FecR family protein [Chitinophaga polysaccharea]|uniref:FecR family protein n=1 Tax=Chitinophaga polysaccharea TaxID=1293035 RepID=UPI001157CB60|nr:FecR family protein [Chitinophaga polysaccharea]